MTPSERFVEEVKRLLTKRGLSHAHLAADTGVPIGEIDAILLQKATISLDVANKIADALTTAVDYLTRPKRK